MGKHKVIGGRRAVVLDCGSPGRPAPAPSGRAAIFLDRDGVINRALVRDGKPYPAASVAEFEILPGVPAACASLKSAGFLLVVATNQPDVGRGTISKDVVEAIHQHMLELLSLDRVEVCYHPGKGASECDCRKPSPGMLLRASRELGIDLKRSWMVGDRWRDIDCGHAAGCRTVLVDHGYSEELRQPPDYRVASLAQAAELILKVDFTEECR
jgi:D-glycero-D-manno-heptose 1,7-bisphosphate phosphatase